LYDGKSFKFGSLEEIIALSVLNNERQIKLIQPIFSVVDPEQASKLLKSYRSLIFPEHKFDDLRYLKKAKDMFDKMRGMNFFIKQIQVPKRKKVRIKPPNS